MKMCCKKDSYYERQACLRDIVMTTLLWECIFRMGGLDI